jgi:hypothetical protein
MQDDSNPPPDPEVAAAAEAESEDSAHALRAGEALLQALVAGHKAQENPGASPEEVVEAMRAPFRKLEEETAAAAAAAEAEPAAPLAEGWPDCLDSLTPFDHGIQAGFPRFVLQAFRNAGAPADFIPRVRLDALLGKSLLGSWPDCPSLPEWHEEYFEERADWDELEYRWFDLTLTDAAGTEHPLRLVYNVGSGDCNDGRWGAIWHRESRAVVARLESTGDCETTIVPQSSFRSVFATYDVPVPDYEVYEGVEGASVFFVIYEEDSEVARWLHLGLILCVLHGWKPESSTEWEDPSQAAEPEAEAPASEAPPASAAAPGGGDGYRPLFQGLLSADTGRRAELKRMLDQVFEEDLERSYELIHELIAVNQQAMRTRPLEGPVQELLGAVDRVRAARAKLATQVGEFQQAVDALQEAAGTVEGDARSALDQALAALRADPELGLPPGGGQQG